MRLSQKAIIAVALVAGVAATFPGRASTPAPFAGSDSGAPVTVGILPERGGTVADMVVMGDSLEVVFVNAGTADADIIGAVQVRTMSDRPIHSEPLHSATVHAGATHRMRVAIPKLARGEYTVYAVVDLGDMKLTAAQAALDVK